MIDKRLLNLLNLERFLIDLMIAAGRKTLWCSAPALGQGNAARRGAMKSAVRAVDDQELVRSACNIRGSVQQNTYVSHIASRKPF
jgi:hypothetical protein